MKTKSNWVCTQQKNQGHSCTQSLKMYHTHVMNIDIQQDLFHTEKDLERSFFMLEAII